MQVRLTSYDGDFTGEVLEYEIKILSNVVELDQIKSYTLESIPGEQSQYMLRLINGTRIIDRQDDDSRRLTGFFILAVPGIRESVRIEIVDNLRELHVTPSSEVNALDRMSEQKALAVLGVTNNSSHEEIETAYLRRIEEYNPEHVERLGEKLKALARAETRRLNQARTLLLNCGSPEATSRRTSSPQ